MYEWEWIVIQLIESFGYEYVFAQPAPALLSPKPKGCIPVILPLGIDHLHSSNELESGGAAEQRTDASNFKLNLQQRPSAIQSKLEVPSTSTTFPEQLLLLGFSS